MTSHLTDCRQDVSQKNWCDWSCLFRMQIMNFVLAAPVLFLAFAGAVTYAVNGPYWFMTGGLLPLRPNSHRVVCPASKPLRSSFLSPRVAVHIYPWCFMAITSLLVMHVQVCALCISPPCCPLPPIPPTLLVMHVQVRAADAADH